MLRLPVAKNPRAKPPKPKQPLQQGPHLRLTAALRARAESRGLSIRELAKLWGRSPTTTHKTLCNQRRVDWLEYLDLCDALKIDDPVKFATQARRA